MHAAVGPARGARCLASQAGPAWEVPGLGGIGSPWLKKYEGDLKHGYLIHNGEKAPIPRAYRKKLSEETRSHIEWVRYHEEHRTAETRERLLAAEAIHKAKLLLYNRDTF